MKSAIALFTLLASISSFSVFATSKFDNIQCGEITVTFSEIKAAYHKNESKLLIPVMCMALAGDDRAATLYAEHYAHKYNDTENKHDILTSYAWYRFSVERASRNEMWTSMIGRIEKRFPNAKQESEDIYQAIKKIAKPRFHFNKKLDLKFVDYSESNKDCSAPTGSRISRCKMKLMKVHLMASKGSGSNGFESIEIDNRKSKTEKNKE